MMKSVVQRAEYFTYDITLCILVTVPANRFRNDVQLK